MALSPFAKLGYSTLRDLKLPEIPFDLLDETLSGMENKINITDASLLKSPDYIQDSDSDRQLAEQINNYQQGVRDQLTDIAASGDTKGYMSALKQAQNQLYSLYRPGGAANILGERLKQKAARDAKIDEFFKDQPALANYYKSKGISELGYNQSTGSYNQIGIPNMVKHITAEDRNKWFNTNLDNVKDSLLSKGVNKSKLDGITTLDEYWQLEGVTKEKLIDAFLDIYPDEFIDSRIQEYNATGQKYDANPYTTDKDGKQVLNENNPIIKEIIGYAKLGEREKEKKQFVKNTNQLRLAKYKHDLDNPFTPPTHGMTNAVTNPYLKNIEKIKVNKDGKLIKTQRVDTGATQKEINTAVGLGPSNWGAGKKTELIEQPLGEEHQTVFSDLKNRFKDLYGKDMSDEKAAIAYNEAIEDRKSSAITFEQINDPKELKRLNDRVLGSEKKIVNIGARPIYFLDSDGNISTPMNAQAAIDRLGTDVLDKGIEGSISADNPLGTPTGDYATAIDKDGNFVTMVIGNRSIEEDQHFRDINTLSKPKYSLKDEVIDMRDEFGRPTGERAIASPIIDVDENGKYRGVGVEVEYFDSFGKSKGKTTLDALKQHKEQTNPYK